MPWRIETDHAGCSGYAVVKESDGKVVGCHDSREKAVRHLQALYAVEKHSPGGVEHDQSTHGHRGGEAGMSRIADLKERGGFTVDVVSGRSPRSGKAVALPGHERVLPIDAGLNDGIAQWLEDNREALSQPKAYMGGWLDRETGQVYLDVSIIVSTAREAEMLMDEYDQKAYYDLDEGKEVRKAEPRIVGFYLPGDATVEEVLEALTKVEHVR